MDGYFWLPTEPDNSKPGRLVTSSTGEVRLAINGTFEPLQVPPPMAEIPRLFGVTKNGEFVTLVHCIPDHFRFRAPGYASQSLVVMRALHLKHDPVCNAVFYRILGWLPRFERTVSNHLGRDS